MQLHETTRLWAKHNRHNGGCYRTNLETETGDPPLYIYGIQPKKSGLVTVFL